MRGDGGEEEGRYKEGGGEKQEAMKRRRREGDTLGVCNIPMASAAMAMA